jgi:hypothetical protein
MSESMIKNNPIHFEGVKEKIYSHENYINSRKQSGINSGKFRRENNINWKRNTKRFYYNYDDKKRYYIPDFYLIDDNIYIEIKGYVRNIDNIKWSVVDNLQILLEKDLKKLNII